MQFPVMRQVVMEFTELAREFDDEEELKVYTSEYQGVSKDFNIWHFKMLHDPAGEVPVGEEVGVFMPVTLSNHEKVKSRLWFKTILNQDDFKVPRCKTTEEKDELKKRYESQAIGKKVIGFQPDPTKPLFRIKENGEYTSYVFKGNIAPCPDEYNPEAEVAPEEPAKKTTKTTTKKDKESAV